ncbi:helix-turn-helix domain-containing protein [Telmatocola sphagniphila]|uniref:helix-turn-helix domain-containing protein n=1 Tax=Telmatocola sphagniphila TaxID=1123043 RepID=UPI001FE45867|nr:helix-turn-helix domain-containing protein [Telmatocola sphagniphila]
MKVALPILLSDEERQTLTSWSRGRSTPAQLVLRAKIILAAAAGVRNKDIAQQCGTSKPTVALADPISEAAFGGCPAVAAL